MSTEIDAGQRWSSVIGGELENTGFGIVCLTKENQVEPWILFEAGAIGRSLASGRVVPLLLDQSPGDVKPPLGQFQAKQVNREGLLDVVRSINKAWDTPISEKTLEEVFDAMWLRLESSIAKIPKGESVKKTNVRSDREILEELVVGFRALDKRVVQFIGHTLAEAGVSSRQSPVRMARVAARSIIQTLKKGDLYELLSPAFVGIDDELFEQILRWEEQLHGLKVDVVPQGAGRSLVIGTPTGDEPYVQDRIAAP